MNTGETIRAKVELPCSIRLSGSELRVVCGVTEELTRESLIVVMSSTADSRRLQTSAKVFIAVELPFSGKVEPRVLECAVTISRVRAFGSGVRIAARVNRMTVVTRAADNRTISPSVARSCAHGHVSAITRSPNDNSVIRTNHLTNLKSHLKGEHTMSFLKNFFAEEEGQGMVEYGLVISLVVVGGITAYTAFGTAITTGLGTVKASIAAGL
jgi:pilus assembly protein Flp/PilA